MSELPEYIESLMSECIECGLCDEACPSYNHGGCSPQSVMNGEDGNVTLCIGCGRCSSVCSSTNPFKVMMYMNCKESNAKIPDAFYETGYVMQAGNHPSRTELPYIPTGDDAYLMAGCTVECKLPFLKYATGIAMDAIGIKHSELPNPTCCTFPVPFRSLSDSERDEYKIKMGDQAKDREIITICPGCADELKNSGVNARHITKLLYENKNKISELPGVSLKVALEPGCALEYFTKEFEDIVRATGATPIGNKIGCCGKSIKGVSNQLMIERQDEIKGADAVIVGCPFCTFKYDSTVNGVPVLHISELIALAAGNSSTQKYHRLNVKS